MKDEGIREIKLLQSLSFRNRNSPGHEPVDAEMENWSKCLHRYDKFPKEDLYKSPHDLINGVISNMYKERTLNYSRNKRINRHGIHQSLGTSSKLLITDLESKPPQIWNGRESNEYLKIRPSKKSTSHYDYSTCITAHPKLPLYVTGNNKGNLSVWSFNNLADSAVGSEFYTYHQKNSGASKKLTIEKCLFSNYGDKLAALNGDGTFFMFNFNMEPNSIYPFAKIKSDRDFKIQDFDFCNRDTVITAVSKKSHGMAIYDLLMPSNKNIIYHSDKLGGNHVCTLFRPQQILTFNSMEKGMLSIFDIRSQRVVNSIETGNEEITAVGVTKDQETLITGSKDGVVKIWDIHNNFELRESIEAFYDPETRKKHEVS